MAKKLGAPITLGVVTVLAILFLTGGNDEDEEILKETFDLKAVYFESNGLSQSNEGYIEIRFHDKTEKTNAVVLEVLGMEESFQKTYLNSEFVEIIPFPIPPKYGWEIHPITLLIDHQEYGKISVKTEIRPEGELAAPIIFGKP